MIIKLKFLLKFNKSYDKYWVSYIENIQLINLSERQCLCRIELTFGVNVKMFDSNLMISMINFWRSYCSGIDFRHWMAISKLTELLYGIRLSINL
jgi:hypothetical protein